MVEYLTRIKPMIEGMNNDIANAETAEHKAMFTDMKRVCENLWSREIEIDKDK